MLARHRFGDHALAYGVQFKHEDVFDEKRDFTGASVGTPITDDSFSYLGFIFQDEWRVTPDLELVLGARVDDASNVDDLIVSPRVAVAYAATSRLKLRGAFSTGFRAPDVFSEDVHVDTLGGVPVPVVNASDLGEERSRTVQAGFDLRSAPGADIPWAWDVTASYTQIADTFVLSRVGAGSAAVDLRENGSGSTVAGLENNVSIRPADTLNLVFGVAAYSSRYEEREVVLDDGVNTLSTRDFLKTPRVTGVAQAVWSPVKTWDIVGGLKYTGPLDVVNNRTATLTRTTDFFVFDLGFVRHFGLGGGSRHLDLSFGVKNLFDQRQRDLESGAERDSDYVYGPRFARSFYTQLRYEF